MDDRSFSLCDLTVIIDCREPYQGMKLNSLFRRLFNIEDGIPHAVAPSILLRLESAGRSDRQPTLLPNSSQNPGLTALISENSVRLLCGSVEFSIDTSTSFAAGILTGDSWDWPIETCQEFFRLCLVVLMARIGRYALHSCGVVNDGTGFLIVGKSGSGKTTLAISLVRQGWGYLSDEALVLRKSHCGVTALAFQRGFSCAPSMASHFPELAFPEVMGAVFNGNKSLVDLEPLFPGQFVPRCRPQVLLFPEVVSTKRSRLVPMDQTSTLISLIQESPLTTNNRTLASDQVDVLKGLAYQATSFRLLAGTDVYDDPEAVTRLLMEAREE